MKKVLLTLCSAWAVVCSAQIVPNGDFELWDTTIVNGQDVINPLGWTSYNGLLAQRNDAFRGVSLTNDAHSGKFAAKIASTPNALNSMAGVLASGFSVAPDQDDGFPITNLVDKVEAYYKYAPFGDDSARIMVLFYLDGVQIGGAYQYIKGATQSYTKFSLQLHYNAGVPIPDKAKVYVLSGDISDGEGKSVLYLDDLSFSYVSTGLGEATQAKRMDVYPNPVQDKLSFMALPAGSKAAYRVADVQGREVLKGETEENQISTAALEQGIYLLEVTGADGSIYQSKFVK